MVVGPEVGEAEHGGPAGEPGGEADAIHEEDEVAGAEVAQAHQGEDDHAGHRGRLLGVDHGEDIGHLALPRPAHEQPGGGPGDGRVRAGDGRVRAG